MRPGFALLVLVATLALAGCGGTDYPDQPLSIGPIGEGSAAVWLYRPAGKPKDLVIYFHGQGGPVETTPVNHLPWIKHLVSRGSVVVYPRFETFFESDPMAYVVEGVRTATKRADVDGLPVLSLGYSRGGALALEYGAVAAKNELPVPDQIMSIFPTDIGNEENRIDLTPLDHSTGVLLQMGEEDPGGRAGARGLLRRLKAGKFPARNIELDFVSTQAGFRAVHTAPLRNSPRARAAFWDLADVLLDEIDKK
jgi:hypothetical protein